MDSSVLFAFALTLIAGLATGIGSIIAFFAKTTNKKYRFVVKNDSKAVF